MHSVDIEATSTRRPICGAWLGDLGRAHVERIRRDARRMGRVIDALLRLSLVTRRPVERADVDLSAVARAIADDLRSTIRRAA